MLICGDTMPSVFAVAIQSINAVRLRCLSQKDWIRIAGQAGGIGRPMSFDRHHLVLCQDSAASKHDVWVGVQPSGWKSQAE